MLASNKSPAISAIKGINIEKRFLLAKAPQKSARDPMAEKFGTVINKRLNVATIITKNRISLYFLFIL